MSTSMFAIKKPGFILPRPYLEKALLKFPSCVGLSTTFAGSKGLVLANMAQPGNVDNLLKIQEDNKDKAIVFGFGHCAPNYSEDEVQPWPFLHDSTGKDVLGVVFMDGDFAPFANGASPKSNARLAFDRYVILKLQKIHSDVGGDLDKFTKELNTELIQQELCGTFLERGAILVHLANGDVSVVSNNELEQQFDWGIVSNHLDYDDVPAATVVEKVVEKAKDLSAQLAAQLGMGTPKNITVADATATATSALQTAGGTKDEDHVMMACPMNVKGNGNIAQWYRDHALGGVCPTNHKDRPVVACRITKAMKKAEEKGTIVLDAKPPTTAIAAALEVAKDVSENVLSMSEKKAFKDVILNRDAIKGMLGPVDTKDPKLLAAYENEKHPDFSDQVGLNNLAETFRWPVSDLIFWADNCPKQMALAYHQLRRDYLMQIQTTPDKVVVPAPEPKKEEPVVIPAAAPPKKSGTSGRIVM